MFFVLILRSKNGVVPALFMLYVKHLIQLNRLRRGIYFLLAVYEIIFSQVLKLLLLRIGNGVHDLLCKLIAVIGADCLFLIIELCLRRLVIVIYCMDRPTGLILSLWLGLLLSRLVLSLRLGLCLGWLVLSLRLGLLLSWLVLSL